MFKTLAIAALIAVGGCTAAQVNQANTVQSDIAAACAVAMTFVPVAGPVAPYIVAGCGTEQAIASLALNPTSLSWVNGLIAQAKTLAAQPAK